MLVYLFCMRFLFQVLKYLKITGEEDISWALMQAALTSVAQTVIIPMQDVLQLGSSARMNIPATQVREKTVLFLKMNSQWTALGMGEVR